MSVAEKKPAPSPATQYRCTSCEITFEHEEGSLRCPRCLRQHGLLEVGQERADTVPGPRLGRRLLVWLLLLILVLAGLVFGAVLLYPRLRPGLPRPGQVAVLEPDLLRRTLVGRGVPAHEVVDPFERSEAITSLVRRVTEKHPQAAPRPLAEALCQELARRMKEVAVDLTGAADAPSRTAAGALRLLESRGPGARQSKGGPKVVTSFELAALLTAVLREAGLVAVMGEVTGSVQAPVRTPDPSGILGRYAVVVYLGGEVGKGPLLHLDPLRALALPSWAGSGTDSRMPCSCKGVRPLDDASAAAHLLALRALRPLATPADRSYKLSCWALEAAMPSPGLHLIRASVLARAGGTQDAAGEASEALALPHGAGHATAAARMLLLAGQPDRALVRLREALQADPKLWPAHMALAALLMTTKTEEADRHLAAAQQVAPQEPGPLLLRAAWQMEQGKASEAVVTLDRVMTLDRSPRTRLMLYEALLMARDTDRAAHLREALLGSIKNEKEKDRVAKTLDAIKRAASEASEVPSGSAAGSKSEDEGPVEGLPPMPEIKLPDVSLKP